MLIIFQMANEYLVMEAYNDFVWWCCYVYWTKKKEVEDVR